MFKECLYGRHAILIAAAGRPRDKRNDLAIIGTARQLLAEQGFESFSLEAISQQTGISRTTINRRWPSKAHFDFEIAHGGGQDVPDVIVEDGLETQILLFADQIYQQYEQQEVGAASIGLAAAFQRNRPLRGELSGPIVSKTRQKWTKIIKKGKL